jgi:hypothetical protein
VAAGRCDYADQFRGSDTPSDVPHALRDFVLVPHDGGGTVVLVDRVVTGAAERGLHVRVRTPSVLALSGDRATSTLGASSLAISTLWSTSGTPSVRDMPQASECPSSAHTCDVSRIASGSEYRIDVAGPAAFAIHVVNAEPSSAPAKPAVLLSGSGYRGVLVAQGTANVAVITNDAADGALGGALTYRVPSATGTVHVIVDAPVDGSGKSDVTSAPDGTDCKLVVTPHVGATGGFNGRPLVLRTADGCVVADDGTQAPMDPGSSGGPGGTIPSGAGTGGLDSGAGGAANGSAAGGTSAAPGAGSAASAAAGAPAWANGGLTSSCAVRAPSHRPAPIALFAGSAIGLWLFSRRRRARLESRHS